eukprot:TRINITY_DN18250_c0_g3_i1.p1 TRINITY_DN18250_c0_g3~~TRINITY_DN18250_c0_g3_i1.p1  ORF type:complete len:958 (-),score=117.64 TRINITY_DN18250_c0_g3_i1:466-3339(-)
MASQILDGRVRAISTSTETQNVVSGMALAVDHNNQLMTECVLEFSKRFQMEEIDVMRCWKAFHEADQDQSNTINVSELRSILEAMQSSTFSDREFNKIMKTFDKDGNGHLDFPEFLEAYSNTPLQRAWNLEQKIDELGRGTRADMEQKRMTPEEKILNVGVPLSSVKRYLVKELEEGYACLSLPWAAAIFIAFACAVLAHEATDQLYAMDQAITFDIEENANFAFSGNVPLENGRMGHKTVYDVNNIGDFWSWMSMGIVPLFFPEGWDVNEPRTNMVASCLQLRQKLRSFGWSAAEIAGWTDTMNKTCGSLDGPSRPERFFGKPPAPGYLYYNNVIGGVRLRQERNEPGPCKADNGGALHPGSCVSGSSMWLRPELRDAIRFDFEAATIPGAEQAYLLSNTLQEEVREQLWGLERKVWFHPETRKIEITLPTYNPHMNLLTTTIILMYMNQAGHIHKIVEPISYWLSPYHAWYNYLFDGIWVCLVLKIVIEESLDVFRHVQILGVSRGFRSYLSPINFVDWAGVLHGVLIMYMWIENLFALQRLDGLLRKGDVRIQGTWTEPQLREDFFLLLDDISLQNAFRRDVLALYPFVVLMRFFKAFSAQPRLALVTNTIVRASTDVAHFGIVFFTVFSVFTISAQIMFGQELHEFATIFRSFNTAFRILLGDFDWDRLREVGRLQAGLWFWCFVWLVNLVMLNMLLAIIMDVYTEVKGTVGSDAETVYSQSYEIYRRWRERRAGRRVSLNHVLVNIDPTDRGTRLRCLEERENDQTMITIEELMKRVQGLNEKQARRILMAAQELSDADNRKSQSLAEAVLDIQDISDQLNSLHVSVEKLIHMNEMATSLLVSTNGRSNQPAPASQSSPHGSSAAPKQAPTLSIQDLAAQTDEVYRRHAEWLQQQHADRFDRLESQMLRLEAKLASRPVPPPNDPPTGGPYGLCQAPMRGSEPPRGNFEATR